MNLKLHAHSQERLCINNFCLCKYSDRSVHPCLKRNLTLSMEKVNENFVKDVMGGEPTVKVGKEGAVVV